MAYRTSNWTGVGGIRTSPWRRESHLDNGIYRDGLRRVGKSGTTSVPEPTDKLDGDDVDTRCRFCVAKVSHECQKNITRPNGNGAPTSSRKVGYTQRYEPHPTEPMRQVLVRIERKQSKAARSKAQRVAEIEAGEDLF